jgi:hypothetical protein
MCNQNSSFPEAVKDPPFTVMKTKTWLTHLKVSGKPIRWVSLRQMKTPIMHQVFTQYIHRQENRDEVKLPRKSDRLRIPARQL